MENEVCALCGQPVRLEGFSLSSGAMKKFCCGGCLSLYQLLNQHGETTPKTNEPTNNTNNEESTE